MLSNRVGAGVGFAISVPAVGDMPDSFAMPCKLIGGDGIC